jgi:hypothetical protein
MIRTTIFAFATAISLAGCSTTGVYPAQSGPEWKDADENGVSLRTGARECKYQAMTSSAAATGIAKQADIAGDLYDQCMRNRGF